MNEWYVMYTNPKKEAFVNGQFLDRGIETFFPCLQFDRGYGRGIRIEPFFPSYVFFKTDLQSRRAYDLSYMPGVRGIVRFDSMPAVVPAGMLELLRLRLDPYERRVLKKTEWLFKPGDKVLITSGPFEGLEAIFERGKSSQERVQILLKMLGAVTRTEIDVRYLQAVGAPSPLATAA
jgi:transcription antitermination factor NusG